MNYSQAVEFYQNSKTDAHSGKILISQLDGVVCIAEVFAGEVCLSVVRRRVFIRWMEAAQRFLKNGGNEVVATDDRYCAIEICRPESVQDNHFECPLFYPLTSNN